MGRMLLVYYSRKGTTKKLAELLCSKLQCDCEELVDTQSRKGIIGFIKSGYQASNAKPTVIKAVGKNAAEYDLVILATPVWAGSISPAIRTYLRQCGKDIKKVAFVAMHGTKLPGNALVQLRQLSAKPVAELDVQASLLFKSETKIDAFVSALKNG